MLDDVSVYVSVCVFILICVGMCHIFLNIFDICIYRFDMLIDISICLLIYTYIDMTLSG